jgi:hypothetical protein
MMNQSDPIVLSLCHPASDLKDSTLKLRSLVIQKGSLLFFIIPLLVLSFLATIAPPCMAEWELDLRNNAYYTDDVALFSATRRLTRHQDPTQPALDSALADQGDGFVYEPMAQVTTAFDLMGRNTKLLVRGQGFVFVDNSRFNHGSLGVQADHDLTSSTNFKLAYFFGPDLFLGKNEVREPEEGGGQPPRFKDEEFTTHYWVASIDQQLPGASDITLRLLGRYGLRNYDKAFDQRDTTFWTIGTHLEWALTHSVDFALGYHYERGLADGRHQTELKDDISYYNHFATGELEIELTEQIGLEFGVHYEFNGWTTGIEEDERKGEHENLVQGDIGTRYQITEAIQMTAGFQAAYRKESFEDKLTNYNIWVGGKMVF